MLEVNRRNARTWSLLGPRGTLGAALLDLANCRDGFAVLSADLGNSAGLKHFMEQFPDRFFNVGIAEQNMIGIAAGIAREGIPSFAISFAPFTALRACEQIRMDMAYMNLPVTAIGMSAGLAQEFGGFSHYGWEDAAVMRSIPGMTVVCPADGAEIVKALSAALDYSGPVYLRLTGPQLLPIVHTEEFEFRIGKGIELMSGTDVVLVVCGSLTAEVLSAAKRLQADGISAAVLDMHTIKPLDTQLLDRYRDVPLMFTVEEHSVTGGLGSAVAEYLSGLDRSPRLERIGLPDAFGKAASYRSLLEFYALTSDALEKRIREKWTLWRKPL